MLVWDYLGLTGAQCEMSFGAQSSFQRTGVRVTEISAIIGALVGSLREPRNTWTLETELSPQEVDPPVWGCGTQMWKS